MPLLGGVVLLAATAVIEAGSEWPLIPLRFFANRTWLVANFACLFSASAFFSWVFLMSCSSSKSFTTHRFRVGSVIFRSGSGSARAWASEPR